MKSKHPKKALNGRAPAIPNRTERTTGQDAADKTAEACRLQVVPVRGWCVAPGSSVLERALGTGRGRRVVRVTGQ
ncbi:hypothetical protein L5D93_14855 [Paenibacillus thiaminolyticus]|nr:hypothetical protein [Paenibacillus thiaminolyticus]